MVLEELNRHTVYEIQGGPFWGNHFIEKEKENDVVRGYVLENFIPLELQAAMLKPVGTIELKAQLMPSINKIENLYIVKINTHLSTKEINTIIKEEAEANEVLKIKQKGYALSNNISEELVEAVMLDRKIVPEYFKKCIDEEFINKYLDNEEPPRICHIGDDLHLLLVGEAFIFYLHT